MRAFLVEEPRSRALRALNYAPAVERIRRAGSSSARPLREIAKAIGPAYGVAFARLPCSSDLGVELLSQGDMFAAEPQGRVIRRDSMPHPERHLVEPGHVLLAGVGTLKENELYGRAILADARLAGKYLSQDAMALVLEDPRDDFSLFAYAWLASPTGTQILRSTSYGTKLLRFRKDLLSTLPVPSAPTEVVRRVATLVRTCSAGREHFLRDLRAARKIVDAIPEVHMASKSSPERRRRSVVWDGPLPSLRAWNFASMGEDLRELRRSCTSTLRDWIKPDGVFKGGRVARIPCDEPHGVDLLSQRDVFAIRPVPRRIRAPSPPLEVQPDYLLVASRGQMNEGALFGRVERGAHTPPSAAISEDILRIVPTSGLGEALYAFLSSDVGHRLLRTTAYGTSIPGMREDLLHELPMPSPDGAWVAAASKRVKAATRARVVAADAEAEAIRIIEQEVLPQWLA